MKIVGHRHPGIDSTVWAAFLSDAQLRKEIRRVFRSRLNLDRESNPQLDLLLTEAGRRKNLAPWLARCLEMLAANAAEEVERAAEANTITSLAQRDRAAS